VREGMTGGPLSSATGGGARGEKRSGPRWAATAAGLAR
jgi:hypothetical protein